jgi:hypothetical protein
VIVRAALCFTDPDVAVTVAVVVVAFVVDELDEPPHPESTPSPATAIATRTSSINLRLFFRPRKQTAAASVVNGNRGFELTGIAAAVVDGLIESDVLAAPPCGTVIGFGLKVHE